MTESPEQNKEVENEMMKFQFVNAVQNGAQRIGNSTGDQPDESLKIQIVHQTFKTENN